MTNQTFAAAATLMGKINDLEDILARIDKITSTLMDALVVQQQGFPPVPVPSTFAGQVMMKIRGLYKVQLDDLQSQFKAL